MTLLHKPVCCAAVLAVMTAIVLPVSAMTAERRSTIDNQEAVAVTIYNENLALVKDTRRLNLDVGVNHVAMREVSARIRPETAQLRSLSDPGGFHLLEQNFDFDLLTPEKLLEKFVGRKVRIARVNPATGAEIIEQAEVLSAAGGVVLKIGDRIETITAASLLHGPRLHPGVETGLHGRIIFDRVPDNLRDRPTLVVQLDNRHSGTQQVELSYLTGGLAWKADYVAELNDKDSALQLHGWVTLTNRSGTGYRNARLQLVAGDVNQVKEELRTVGMMRHMKMADAAKPASMAQESLFEYHLYTLNRLTTISDNQTKQVALLSAPVVPVKKEFLLSGNDYYYRSSYGDLGQKMKVGVFVHFDNRESAGLGMPLPKGVVRVYKKDRAGNAQFIGEDRIDHTPKNETVRLKLGDAFDVTASKKQTAFQRRPATSPHSYAYESAYEIVLKNAKKEAVTVTVREPVPGDWRILASSHGHEKMASGTAQWKVMVPAGGETRLNWRVLLRF